MTWAKGNGPLLMPLLLFCRIQCVHFCIWTDGGRKELHHDGQTGTRARGNHSTGEYAPPAGPSFHRTNKYSEISFKYFCCFSMIDKTKPACKSCDTFLQNVFFLCFLPLPLCLLQDTEVERKIWLASNLAWIKIACCLLLLYSSFKNRGLKSCDRFTKIQE